MATKTIPLSEAKQPEMRAFAKNVCGLNLGFGGVSNDDLRAKIAACGYDQITVEVADAAAPAAPARPAFKPGPVAADPLPADMGEPRKLRIIIARSEEPGGDQPVPVSVNGRAMLIPRGEEVPVPEMYVKVLKDAISWRYEQRDLGNGQMEMVKHEVPRYPFQVIGVAA